MFMVSGETLHRPDCAEWEVFSMFLRCRCGFSKLRNPSVALLPRDLHKSPNLPWPQFPPIRNENLHSSIAEQSRGGTKGAEVKGQVVVGMAHLLSLPPSWVPIQGSHRLHTHSRQWTLSAFPSSLGWAFASDSCPDRGGPDNYCLIITDKYCRGTSSQKAGTRAAGCWALTLLS